MKSILIIISSLVCLNLYSQVDEINRHYQAGRKYYDSEMYFKAIEEFNYCYKIKDDPTLAFWLAYSWAKVDNYEKCKYFYLIALENNNILKKDYRDALDQLSAWLEAKSTERSKKLDFSGEISGSISDSLMNDSTLYNNSDTLNSQ